MELSLIRQESLSLSRFRTAATYRTGNGILCYLFQTNTADSTHFRTKITAEERFAQSDAFEDLGTTVRTDGRDTHLRHYLEKTFFDGLDVVGLSGGIVFLNLTMFHKVVQNGKYHIRTQRGCTIAKQ